MFVATLPAARRRVCGENTCQPPVWVATRNAVSQALLFSDPKPLVKRLGKNFFRQLPRRSGVYLMRDAEENILYVGKAKNLKQRLNCYRVANPDRLGRRHLKLLREVVRIEWKLCRDENSALAHEAELLRSIRPKYNRAGVWPTKARSLLWRSSETGLLLKIADGPELEWQMIGPLKGVRWLRLTLARLLWMATHAGEGIQGLPLGWHEGKIQAVAVIGGGKPMPELADLMRSLNETGAQRMINWIRQRTNSSLTAFEIAWLEAELEALADFPLARLGPLSPTAQIKDEQRLFAFA
jgi:predicted GIY-YIG superfamily endonuclease